MITTPESAEAIKYASNAFLAVKISFANEMALYCEKFGCDVKEVLSGVGLDPRIGTQFLEPGIGWGGSCFPKDTSALVASAHENGLILEIVQSAMNVNTKMVDWYVQRVIKLASECKTDLIACLGVAFKPGTDDTRESQAIKFIQQILIQSDLKIKVTDPRALEQFKETFMGDIPANWTERMTVSPNLEETVCNAGLVVILTEWSEYKEMNLEFIGGLMSSKVLIDARNCISLKTATLAGFKYVGMGRFL